MRGDRGPAGGELVQHGGFEVAEHGHGHGPGNRRGRHDQQVRRLAGLGPEGVALFHAEAVLFVHHNQAEVIEGHVVAEQGVGADHDSRPFRRRRPAWPACAPQWAWNR